MHRPVDRPTAAVDSRHPFAAALAAAALDACDGDPAEVAARLCGAGADPASLATRHAPSAILLVEEAWARDRISRAGAALARASLRRLSADLSRRAAPRVAGPAAESQCARALSEVNEAS